MVFFSVLAARTGRLDFVFRQFSFIGVFTQRNEAWNVGLLFISNKFQCSKSFFAVYGEIVSSCGTFAVANILFSVVPATSRTLSFFIVALIFVSRPPPFSNAMWQRARCCEWRRRSRSASHSQSPRRTHSELVRQHVSKHFQISVPAARRRIGDLLKLFHVFTVLAQPF